MNDAATGRLIAACGGLQLVVTHAADWPDAWYQLGAVCLKLGSFDNAGSADAIFRGIATWYGSPDEVRRARQAWANALEQLGRQEDAEEQRQARRGA